ncbi:MAG TPA: hypothetical protein VIW80_13170 [Pyrinomonadaceae bacterium]|jgi:hypothetical protein
MVTAAPTLAQVVSEMMNALNNLLPAIPPPPLPPGQPLPARSVSLVSVTEKTVGLGNRLGIDTQGPLSVSVLKGVRLDAVVRFQFWGNDPAEADDRITEMHGLLLAAKEQLKAQGFLTITGEETSLADNVPTIPAWRKTASYRLLYEFPYKDNDDAGGLIARIPININSVFNESTLVTDEMVHWDNEFALTLEVRRNASGPFPVGELAIVAFLPILWDGDGVTISAFVGGVLRQRAFASVRDFRNAFTLEPDPIELGGHSFLAGRMVFPNPDFPDPIVLARGEDFFQVVYASPPLDDINAGVYLRVLR